MPTKGRSRLEASDKKTITRGIIEATEKASKREENTGDKTKTKTNAKTRTIQGLQKIDKARG